MYTTGNVNAKSGKVIVVIAVGEEAEEAEVEAMGAYLCHTSRAPNIKQTSDSTKNRLRMFATNKNTSR